MGKDVRGLSSLPWAGLNPSAGPRSLEQMAEIPEDTAPSELEGMGVQPQPRGAPTGPPLLYSEAARGKRLSPSQMAATCHPSTQDQLPKAEQAAEGCRAHASPKRNSPHTKRLQSLAQTSSSLGETPKPSQHRLAWEG